MSSASLAGNSKVADDDDDDGGEEKLAAPARGQRAFRDTDEEEGLGDDDDEDDDDEERADADGEDDEDLVRSARAKTRRGMRVRDAPRAARRRGEESLPLSDLSAAPRH